jgi:hypothetical protein
VLLTRLRRRFCIMRPSPPTDCPTARLTGSAPASCSSSQGGVQARTTWRSTYTCTRLKGRACLVKHRIARLQESTHARHPHRMPPETCCVDTTVRNR